MSQLARRAFSSADLIAFAQASGDWNPIHVDALAARRMLGGAQVTHGILVLLWALEAYYASIALSERIVPARVRVTFHRPVLVDQSVNLVVDTTGLEAGQVRLAVQGAEPMATVLLTPGGERVPDELAIAPVQATQPGEWAFSQLKAHKGELPVRFHGALPDLARQYPVLSAMLGGQPVAAFMALSRLVGMECPGLHSLFAGLDVAIKQDASGGELVWQVARHTIQQAPLRIQINGGGLSGGVDAFVRPAPVAQPLMSEVRSVIAPQAYVGQTALIVGGSRGLGELTAKIVAAGGGEAIITYAHGRDDALRVAAEIQAGAGRCRVIEMDVLNPEAALLELRAGVLPTHCYYFASCRIEPQQRVAFDPHLYASFGRIYVEAFGRLMVELAGLLPAGWLAFYPSTVFIDESPREFGEYIVAKTAGEALCAHINRLATGGTMVSHRLPRMLTDQTAGILRRGMADALPILTGVVNELHQLTPRKDAAS